MVAFFGRRVKSASYRLEPSIVQQKLKVFLGRSLIVSFMYFTPLRSPVSIRDAFEIPDFDDYYFILSNYKAKNEKTLNSLKD